MKVTTEYEVTGCNDCPFAYAHYGHGECWTECSHKNHGRGYYENILWGCQERFTRTPDWCPLGLGGEHESMEVL